MAGEVGQIGGMASGLAGMFGPIGQGVGAGISLGTGIYSMMEGNRAQKKAREANEQRYQMLLDLYRTGAMNQKAGVALSGQQERGDIAQRHIGTGLYNSTALDSAYNMSRNREALAGSQIDAQATSNIAGVMERRTDAYPDLSGVNASMGAAGQNFAALLGSYGAGDTKKNATSESESTQAATPRARPTYAGDDATPMREPAQRGSSPFGDESARKKRRFKVSNRSSSYAVQ
jgi:hypothetical protein